MRGPCLARAVLAVACLLAGARRGQAAPPAGPSASIEALRLAIADLSRTFPDRYPRGAEWLARADALAQRAQAAATAADNAALTADLAALQREALLANPLLAGARLLCVKRAAAAPRLGLPQNWQGNCSLPRNGYDDELVVVTPGAPTGTVTTLYHPAPGGFVGDVALHFAADRLLFSALGARKRWHIFELALATGQARQVTPDLPDVDSYDACYLPDGRIVFTSTACLQGVPCVAGSDHVANLYRLDADGGNVQQLSFDQDHNWCPRLLADGRVLYTRWEYTDMPHAFNRQLFSMNPDGTGQMSVYGSNSYWPNTILYARQVPGQPTRLVGIVGGHHGSARAGELVLFDVAQGRQETAGVVQRLPGRGLRVEPILRDALVDDSWPKFLHPFPLGDPAARRGEGTYVLVSCQLAPGASWGICLVDSYDNLVPLASLPGQALFEPIPLRPSAQPPTIPDRVTPGATTAVVYVENVYQGPGLRGIPRGAVKRLRVYSYHFAYQGMGGQQMRVGLDGPWDVRCIQGTVPVQADGSALFRVPANTPLALQPLDADGQALQLMRSWLTARPGERLSCAGCHESANSSTPNTATLALRQPPADIAPWHGPARGFAFRREVQPVLDRHCLGCHGGQPRPDGRTLPDLRDRDPINVNPIPNLHGIGNFTPSYFALRRLVRGPTAESDMHMLPPAEFHASTTKLVQMLRAGHHGVQLDAEAWDRLITWIDLNTPCHGSWAEVVGPAAVTRQQARRHELRELFTGVACPDPEAVVAVPCAREPVSPAVVAEAAPAPAATAADWPLDAAAARARQGEPAAATCGLDLGAGVTLELRRVPAGAFVMGDAAGERDERPPACVRIERAFWIGTTEVSNRQYGRFDSAHDSFRERSGFLQFNDAQRGVSMNQPEQPVVRVSWRQAEAFCRWLAARTGRPIALPTEAQWEYACRAGTATPLWYGAVAGDFAAVANLADGNVNDRYGRWQMPLGVVPPYHPAVDSVDDGARVTAAAGRYQPNAWGLRDMAGNAAEWTSSLYRPYPWREDDGRNAAATGAADGDRRVVRGGSWYDRPERARSASRAAYPAWQAVFDVGFRIVCLD